jgi:hypothetical protein
MRRPVDQMEARGLKPPGDLQLLGAVAATAIVLAVRW